MTVLEDLDRAKAASNNRVSRAQADHREAGKLLAALEEAVRSGDPGVKPKELGEARNLVHHAELQIEAARREAVRQVAEARQAAYVATGTEARAFTDAEHHSAVADALTAALDAMTALWTVTASRAATLKGIAARATTLGEVAKANGERLQLREAGIGTASLQDVIIFDGADGSAGRKQAVEPIEAIAHLVSAFLGPLLQSGDADRYALAPLMEALQAAGARRAETEFGHLVSGS